MRRFLLSTLLLGATACAEASDGPNVLLFVTDDQSWLYVGAYGSELVRTPAMDRVAREGVLFTHAFVASPSCTPSRSAILTSQDIWRLGVGGEFGATLPVEYPVFPLLLEEEGYAIGWTGKGWGPGKLEEGGWGDSNPLGRRFDEVRNLPPRQGPVGHVDYSGNFEAFLEQRDGGRPFFFWCGTTEPHRPFQPGSGLKAGKRPEDVVLPPFLPDAFGLRSDFLDYCVEIEYADRHLGEMLEILERRGELDDTLILVTSDNGVPLPRCKSTLYDVGTRVPLLARWPAAVPAGRVVDDVVCLTDLGPTLLELAGAGIPEQMTGESLAAILLSERSGWVEPERDAVYTALQSGYPMRAIRTHEYLYVRNLEPDLDATPSKNFLTNFADEVDVEPYLEELARRPAEELYRVADDPWQMVDLADDPSLADVKAELAARLDARLGGSPH